MTIHRLRLFGNRVGLAALGVAPAIDEVRAAYPWAESALVGAICYLPPERISEAPYPTGAVARFARSVDYHDVMRSKLQALAGMIAAELPQTKCEVCVDTVPLPERRLAVLSGIATRGRSGNVFVDGCGSYASIGEIITNLRLPVEWENINSGFDQCGECGRCAKACPGGAILGDGVVDASRCVSRLTQMPGIVPRELRHRIGDRIYGCDVCQEVCPRNAGVIPLTPEFELEVFPGARPDLVSLIALTSSEFSQRVKHSSIGWIRRTRIRRNAAIVAGNTKCAEAVGALIDMLNDENPILRAHAAWALGEIGSEDALNALKSALGSERDPDVVEEINAALANK